MALDDGFFSHHPFHILSRFDDFTIIGETQRPCRDRAAGLAMRIPDGVVPVLTDWAENPQCKVFLNPNHVGAFRQDIINGLIQDGDGSLPGVYRDIQLIDPVAVQDRPWGIDGEVVDEGSCSCFSQQPGRFTIGHPFFVIIDIHNQVQQVLLGRMECRLRPEADEIT